MTIAVCMAILVGLATLAVAVTARAAGYHVYSCRTPWGAVAPAEATGWTGSVSSGGSFDDYALNTCASGGALIAALGDATNHELGLDKATWVFTCPPRRYDD